MGQRKTNSVCSHLHVESKKKIKEQNYPHTQSQTDRERKQIGGCQTPRVGGWRSGWR